MSFSTAGFSSPGLFFFDGYGKSWGSRWVPFFRFGLLRYRFDFGTVLVAHGGILRKWWWISEGEKKSDVCLDVFGCCDKNSSRTRRLLVRLRRHRQAETQVTLDSGKGITTRRPLCLRNTVRILLCRRQRHSR